MKLDLLYNGETGEYKICLRPAEEMSLPSPGAVLTRLGCAEDLSRRCIELFTTALLADRAADQREAQGDGAAARVYRQKARDHARRAMRVLWRIRDEQAAAVPPPALSVTEDEAEALSRLQAAAQAFSGPSSCVCPESMRHVWVSDN